VLLATTCPVCGRRGPAPCPSCLRALRPAPALAPPPGVDACRALLAYEGAGRELVARLKHRNHRAALPGLAAAAASLVLPEEVDVVTWAPTTTAHRRARGFDQSELLARAVARRLGRPCRRLLQRTTTATQVGRSAAERWSGPCFAAIRRPSSGARVLLVDDVVTTGATVATASRALRLCGASRVVVLALARTPIKVTTERDDG
jgi:ComF family protein